MECRQPFPLIESVSRATVDAALTSIVNTVAGNGDVPVPTVKQGSPVRLADRISGVCVTTWLSNQTSRNPLPHRRRLPTALFPRIVRRMGLPSIDNDLPEKGSPKVSRPITAFALAVIILGLTTCRARADLVVSLSNVNLTPGSTGIMDITVTSNNNDTLSAFGLELQILPVGTPTSVLQFTTSQPDPYGNSNYVFRNESFNSDNGLPLWAVPATPPSPFVSILGGDLDDSTQGYVSIPSTAPGPHTYLASVQFQAPEGATLGDQFQISLVNDPNFTFFDDKSGNNLVPFSSVGGGVAVEAVPEPSSFTVAAFCSVIGLLYFNRTRRQSRSASVSSAAYINWMKGIPES